MLALSGDYGAELSGGGPAGAAGHPLGHLAARLRRTLFGFSAYKSMRRIPKEMFEAGMLDGANDWKLLKICVPMCKNVIYPLLSLCS